MSSALKDPVCGMTVLPGKGLTALYNGQTVYFCSEFCRGRFLEQPDAEDLYEKLKMVGVPTFYRERERWEEMMQHSIALNASHFNTHRMVQQYVINAYLA